MTLAHESKLGDFLADCLRYGGQTELSYMNTTSACGELLPGEITREELLYCAAFDDETFTGIITGAQLHALLEAVYEPERFGNNAAIAFSGFHAAVDHTRPGGQKVLLSRGRTARPLRRTSASASRSAPIWPPAAMTPEPLPDRSTETDRPPLSRSRQRLCKVPRRAHGRRLPAPARDRRTGKQPRALLSARKRP